MRLFRSSSGTGAHLIETLVPPAAPEGLDAKAGDAATQDIVSAHRLNSEDISDLEPQHLLAGPDSLLCRHSMFYAESQSDVYSQSV